MPRKHETASAVCPARLPFHQAFRQSSRAHSLVRLGSTWSSLFFVLFSKYPSRYISYHYCSPRSYLLRDIFIFFDDTVIVRSIYFFYKEVYRKEDHSYALLQVFSFCYITRHMQIHLIWHNANDALMSKRWGPIYYLFFEVDYYLF